jgi:ABC-2 type transport system permease protein
MFKNIFLTEFRKNISSPAFFIFFIILLVISIIFAMTTDTGTYLMGVNHGKEIQNAPIVLAQLIARFSVLGVLFSIVIIGRAVAKDFEANIHEFIFASPVSKTSYLFGRLSGSTLANLLIFIAIPIGYEIGLFFVQGKEVGAFKLSSYVLPFLISVIPNLLLIGSVFFALATLTRKMTATYLSGIGFLAIYTMIGVLLHRMDNEVAKVLLDPFGITSLTWQTRFWTVSEMNTLQMPINNLLISNRIIWSIIAIMILIFTYYRFRFVAFLEERKVKKERTNESSSKAIVKKPIFSINRNNNSVLVQLFSISWRNFIRILLHPAFLILAFLAISQITGNFIGGLGNSSGSIYPFTSWYIEQTFHLWMYMMPMIIFFGGMLIWKEHDYKTNEIVDTLPVPSWLSYASKFLTLVKVQVLYLLVAIIAGIITQVFFLDFNNIELGLYIKQFFGIDFFAYIQVIIIVLFIQNLSPNKILGFFFSAIYFMADILIYDVLGFENYLFRIGRIPAFIYSNINGFGHFAPTIIWYTIYWLFFGGILAWLTILLWRKTNENSLKLRVNYLINNLTNEKQKGLLLLFSLFIIAGVYIGINKYFVNPHLTEHKYEKMQANYEKKYVKYLDATQPTIVDIYVKADLFPHKRKIAIQGKYVLYNHTNKQISELYINLNDWNLKNLKPIMFDKPFKKTHHAKEFGFRIFNFEEAIQPNDSIEMTFEYVINPKGFSDIYPMSDIAENGTCIDITSFGSQYFPLLGYSVNNEIVEDRERKKYDLLEKVDAPTLEEADQYTAIFQLSRPNYEAVLSTSSDQIAITSGKLIKEWKEGDRNYYHYKTDTIIENEIVILSGQYAIKRENHNGVNVEVYYHPEHNYNIDRIMDGLKDSHDYGSKYFMQYPYSDLRIVEIPNYMTEGAARHYPTTFIWKESEGFITKYNKEDIDIVYGIAAHENIHHWWAGIVTPAYAEGAFMLTETICQYAMAMLTEHKYGKEIGRKYVQRELRSYLVRRKKDIEGEKPLMRSTVRQAYLGYKKSTSVMYALQDYISEDSVGKALGRVVDQYKFKLQNYPLSINLVDEIKKVTPDSLQYLVVDLFEKITLYENKVDTITYSQLENGKYKVNLNLQSHKFYADSIGNQTETKINDYVYVAVLGEDKKELYYEKRLFDTNEKQFEIIVDEEPVEAGIDPFVILIDRDKKDNLMKATKI